MKRAFTVIVQQDLGSGEEEGLSEQKTFYKPESTEKQSYNTFLISSRKTTFI